MYSTFYLSPWFLFFIQYILEDTIKLRWFLIKINHHKTEILNMDSLRIKDYHVTFLSRHFAEKYLCDDVFCWWPEWHEYSFDNSNIGKQDLTKYILWTDLVHLTDTSCFLHGPFNLTHNLASFLLTNTLLYVIGSSS